MNAVKLLDKWRLGTFTWSTTARSVIVKNWSHFRILIIYLFKCFTKVFTLVVNL